MKLDTADPIASQSIDLLFHVFVVIGSSCVLLGSCSTLLIDG